MLELEHYQMRVRRTGHHLADRRLDRRHVDSVHAGMIGRGCCPGQLRSDKPAHRSYLRPALYRSRMMPVSRRSFVATLGAGATGILSAPILSWRGHEALFAQQQQPQLAAAEPHAERLLASMPGMVRLDSNENPNGPGQRALAAITAHFGDSNRYPVKQPDDLLAEIAKVQGVRPENVILGCGSGELLRTAVMTFTSRDKALVAPDPTFESPGNFAKFLGNPIRAPKVDSVLKLDLNATADAARGAGLVYYCNPNNPTATVHGASDTKAFVEQVLRASPDTTILIDEAYHEYVADPSYTTMMPLAVTNPRVIVTRTFSKV